MKKILVIEDDPSVRAGIVDLLREEGFNVTSAENGKKGVEYAKEYLPDLVISDILMPEMDGVAVLEALQAEAKTASIPFIFLTAKSGTSDIRSGMNIGADDYLTKPYKSEDLLNAVNSRLKRQKLKEEKFREFSNNVLSSFPREVKNKMAVILGLSSQLINDTSNLSYPAIKNIASDIHNSGREVLGNIKKMQTVLEIENPLPEDKLPKIIEADFYIQLYSEAVCNSNNRKKDLKLHLQKQKVTVSKEFIKLVIDDVLLEAIRNTAGGTSIYMHTVTEGEHFVISVKYKKPEETVKAVSSDTSDTEVPQDNYFLKRVVEAYRGTLRVTDTPEGFSETKIYIPISIHNKEK